MALLDTLLEKPEAYRRKVAFAATGVLALLIIMAWLLIASQNIQQAVQPFTDQNNAVEQKKLPSLQDETVKTQLMKEQPGTGQPTGQGQPQPTTPNNGFDSLMNPGNPTEGSNPTFDSKIIERK